MADKDKGATSKSKKGAGKAKKPATKKKDEDKPEKEYKPREPKGKKPLKKPDNKKPKDEKKETKPEDEAKTKKKHDKLVREGKRIIEKEEVKEKDKEDKKEEGKDKDKGKETEKDKAKAKSKPKPKVKPLNIAWELRKRAVREKQQRMKEIEKLLNKAKGKDKQKDKAKDKGKDKSKDKAKDKDKEDHKVIEKEILEEGKESDQYKDLKKKKEDDEDEKKLSKSKSKRLKRDSEELKTESKEEKGHNKDLLDTVYHKMEVVEEPKEHKIKREPETVIEFKYNKFEDVEEQVKEQEKEILQLMHKVFQWYKPDEVMLSFNGGKDCTVVLHMLNKFFQTNSCLKHIKIPALYITDPDAFEEIDQFVNDCEQMFNIELIKKKGPIKEALKVVCEENKKLKAVFMGCRRTDPYCKTLKVTQMTDPGWPPLMRINPIIDWKCRQVWEYIYLYNVPYCLLYQKGYTSIGNKKNTKPNPHLRLIDPKTGKVFDYRPGHELIDNDELERAGRF